MTALGNSTALPKERCLQVRRKAALAIAAGATGRFVRVSTVEASRSEGSVWISPVFAQTNGRSGEYRRAAENCVQCARAVSALAFAARAKGRFVRRAAIRGVFGALEWMHVRRTAAKSGDLNRSTQHTLRTSPLAFDIARSCEGVR